MFRATIGEIASVFGDDWNHFRDFMAILNFGLEQLCRIFRLCPENLIGLVFPVNAWK